MSVAINKAILFKSRTTPPETVDAGEAYFWLEGSSLKYKDDTQTVYVLSSGVTPEDVQDIVAAFLQAGSSKISIVYNDPADTLTFDVVESNIIHQNLSGAGTNTHAQIDSHIANTSNPHSVTKAQVGLGNADNTSDVNKPVSTAQAAADSAVQAFSIQRSNHTGTQTASTISDFNEVAQDAVGGILTDTASVDLTYNDGANQISAAVLPAGVNHDALQNFVANEHIDHTAVNINAGTGLSGGGNISSSRTLNIANTAVTAGTYGASGVPQFTVNAQGQLTAASDGPALVIGDNFENFLDNTTFTTTAATEQVAATFSTTSKTAGGYRISINWTWAISVTNFDAIFRVYVDGVQIDGDFREEASETANQRFENSWTFYTNFPTTTTHTIQLRTLNEVAAPTISVFFVRAEIWRVS